MNKLPNWRENLMHTIHDARAKEFGWGTHDCVLFTCACIEAMTGKNLAQDSIGRYASHRQALREIRRLGFKGAEDMCDAYLGERYSTPLFAKFGDVVLINNPTGEPQLGICMGSYVLTTTEDVGLTVAGMDLWGSAWAN